MQAQMQQLRSRPAPTGNRAAVLTATPKYVAARQQRLRSRQLMVPAAVPDDDSKQPKQAGPGEEDINSRILSGEFTDSGSTKEKLTRPIRKALAQDPVGIGERLRPPATLAAHSCWLTCCC